MTAKEMLFQLWDYNRWANLQLMEKAKEMPSEELWKKTKELKQGSLMNTFIYMLENERAWRKMAAEGEKPEPFFEGQENPDLDTLLGWWDAESREMQVYLNSLSEIRLGGTMSVHDTEGNEYPMVVWQMLMQAFLNSMRHRVEAASYMTDLGFFPGELDFIFFV